MPHLNIEIKAHTESPDAIRAILQTHKADFRGTDHQTDTYFHCPNGRLKLREGNIEKTLIHYHRDNQAGPKSSHVHLFRLESDTDALRDTLTAAYEVWKVVRKAREIYFIENVKFHLDTVADLGEFVEIEAIDFDGTIGKAKLETQCQHYIELFQIADSDLLTHSYSDMI